MPASRHDASPSPPQQAVTRPLRAQSAISDAECDAALAAVSVSPAAVAEKREARDIEHVEVENDPREWSGRTKTLSLVFACWVSMASSLSANIYLPAIDALQRELDASQQVVNLSVSLFILLAGMFPMLWSGISEIYGRKIVYLVALSLFTGSSVACSVARSPGVFLAFRLLASAGSSCGLTMGGATIADMYEPHERGTRVGIFYLAYLLGPSLGTFIGGALTLTRPSWRATFYFMSVYGAISVLWAAVSRDSFRRERSLAWRKAFERARKQAERLQAASELEMKMNPQELEVQEEGRTHERISTAQGKTIDVKIRFSDINPLSAALVLLRRPTTLLALLASALLFGAQYSTTFTAALSFARAPYSYSSLIVGCVLLAFGAGNVLGSIGGGKYSDVVLARCKRQASRRDKEEEEEEGSPPAVEVEMVPEWRLRATLLCMPFVPLSFLAYAWTVEERVPVYWPVIVLFCAGFSSIWVYSATLSYIIDSSTGMASSAVSLNALFRGAAAFIASEVAQPILDSVGNGVLYSIWAGLLAISVGTIAGICWKGKGWRENAVRRSEERKLKGKK